VVEENEWVEKKEGRCGWLLCVWKGAMRQMKWTNRIKLISHVVKLPSLAF